MKLLVLAPIAAAAAPVIDERLVPLFILQVAVLLVVGRGLGELMQRMGQPSVMGQLLAGIVLGPSILGLIAPGLQHALFPPDGKQMVQGVAQLGVLMLLLLTGMETDLELVGKMRRTAFFASLGGIVLPFASGFLLGELLPSALLPDPSRRYLTSLFLAIALSISSVKIVAMVLIESGFVRRNVGQAILAAAILDDTIGWILVGIVSGLAERGAVDPVRLTVSVVGSLTVMLVALTYGRRVIGAVIRWTNDTFRIEMPVITLILVIMCLLALLTDVLGVHTVLGAFVAGIVVRQSPIMNRHIQEQLRGLIVALFMPIFFGMAGLSTDLAVLGDSRLLLTLLALIAIASVGKIGGCYAGGRLGGLSSRESTALAIGMNARGSTEVIVATIGLTMGALSLDLFTLVVFMAISTTLITPPLLRWALTRIPPHAEETRLRE